MADYKELDEVSTGTTGTSEAEKYHSSGEIANVYRCNKLEREWLHDSSWPSGYAISLLHATLFENVESYTKKGTTPLPPGVYRLDDLRVSGEPNNFYVRGLDVAPLMRAYTKKLDQIIQELPHSPICMVTEMIHHAAWAYYVFIRIHPFLDGNGRMGRILVQRILKGAGFRDLVYQQVQRGKKKLEENREQHLNAMNRVDQTGNLASLEIYLAKMLLARYSPTDGEIYLELRRFIGSKNKEIQTQQRQGQLKDIWPEFANIDIYGNEETLEEQEFSYSAPHTSN